MLPGEAVAYCPESETPVPQIAKLVLVCLLCLAIIVGLVLAAQRLF